MKKKKYENGERYTEISIPVRISGTGPGGIRPIVTWGEPIQVTDENGNDITAGDIIVSKKGPRKNKDDKVISQAINSIDVLNPVKCMTVFDSIYGIDTNTKKVQDKYISIGVIIKANIIKETDVSGRVEFCMSDGYLETCHEQQYSRIEPFMWRYGIERILQMDRNERIAIIVDSDRGNLENYNLREMAIHDSFFLPDNCSLIYASCDPVDNWTNKLIRLCNNQSNLFFKQQYGL